MDADLITLPRAKLEVFLQDLLCKYLIVGAVWSCASPGIGSSTVLGETFGAESLIRQVTDR